MIAGLAEDLRRDHARPDDDDGGFGDRAVRLGTTFDGAGRLEGDLTARCAAAVEAVLDALGTVRGPEDIRTMAQRRHDALEEACLRLIGAGMLPQRAGQPVRLDLTITLQELIDNAGGIGCDALIQPVITGHADYELIEQLLTDDGYRDQLAARCRGQASDDRFGALLGGSSETAVRSGRARRRAAPQD